VNADLLKLASRIDLYTPANKFDIPAVPGIYAWFFPLWMFSEDIDEVLRSFAFIHNYDPLNDDEPGEPRRAGSLAFNWDEIVVSASKRLKLDVGVKSKSDFERLITTGHRSQLQALLLACTLFSPPLYVGLTDNLSVRYSTHAGSLAPTRSQNSFAKRFAEHVARADIGSSSPSDKVAALSVSDLLFACIPLTRDETPSLDSDSLRTLISVVESIQHRICRPAYSER